MTLTRADFESWRLLVQPVLWYYEGDGPDWYPGVYLGPGPLRAPGGGLYSIGADIGLGPGVKTLLNDSLDILRLPSGTVLLTAAVSIGEPPGHTVGDVWTVGVVRTTKENMFTGDALAGASIGYFNATQAVDATGRGAYTISLVYFGGFLEWAGHAASWGGLAWTGKNVLLLVQDAPGTDFPAYPNPYPPRARLFISNDDGVLFEQNASFLASCPAIEINESQNGRIVRGGTPNTADQIQAPGEFAEVSGFTWDVMVNVTGVVSVQSVRRLSDSHLYVQGTDYNLVGNTIDWSPSGGGTQEPSAGDVCRVAFHYDGPPPTAYCVQSDGAGTCYAIVGSNLSQTEGVHVLRSLDDGVTWTYRSTITPQPNGNPSQQMLVVLDANTLVTSSGSTLIRSTNGGLSWTTVYTHAVSLFVPPSIVRPRGSVLVATMIPGSGASANVNIVRSEDGGLTWSVVYTATPRLGSTPPDINGAPMSLGVSGPNEMLAMSQFGRVFFSPDLGAHWEANAGYSQVPNFPFLNSSPIAYVNDGVHTLIVVAPDSMVFVNVPQPTKTSQTPLSIIKGRTIYVSEQEYQYTYQQNREDFGTDYDAGADDTGGARELYIQVRMRAINGKLGPPAVMHVKNPAPDMSGTVLTVDPVTGGLLIGWASYKAIDPDPDYFEIRLGFSNDPGSLTKTFRRSHDQNNVLIPNLEAGVTVFFQVVPFDVFGAGIPTAIYSGVPS